MEHLEQVLLRITLIRHHQLTLLVKYFLMFQLNLEAQDDRKIGLLKVQSNMIYSGYVDVEVVQPHSWIETGDYAYIQNNQLYLVSRKSDRLIIGVKIYILM